MTSPCRTHAQLGRPLEVLRLRRAHHERSATSETYQTLKVAALALDTWDRERDAARAALRGKDSRGYVLALLADGEDDLAWRTAAEAPEHEIDRDLWLTLAEARLAHHPADALGVYLRIADEILLTTDRRAYTRAVRVLKQARTAAQAAGRTDSFTVHIALLHDQHRRRPTLIALLDKAGLTSN